MKTTTIVLVLMIGIVVVLGFGDALNTWGLASWSETLVASIVLLVGIPISLGLFVFISHRQHEDLKARDHEEPER